MLDGETFEGETVPGIEQTPEVETQPGEQKPTTVTEPVSQPEPAWKKQYATEDAMYADLKKFQGERDRYEAEVRKARTQAPPQTQPTQRTPEQVLEELVRDPDAYIEKRVMERVMPFMAKAEIERYETVLPGFKEMKAEIREIVEANPAILNTPFGIEMVYNHVAKQHEAQGRVVASTAVDAARQKAEETKRNEAFVEGSGQPKRSTQPLIKTGMSVEESNKALDALGIGWNTEDPYATS